MNRKEAAELLPIIKAFSEGKVIQTSVKGKPWEDLGENIAFYTNDKYRIKPESAYRPFANAEECWQGMQNHQPFGWVKDKVADEYINVYCVSNNSEGKELLKHMFKKYVFIDKNPFGVKDEED